MLSEEEKQVLQTFKNGLGLSYAEEEILLNLIDRLQKELDKKDKVIDLMAESWKQDDVRSVEKIKEYFYKQADVEDLLKEN